MASLRFELNRSEPALRLWALVPASLALLWTGPHLAGLLSRIELPHCVFKALSGLPCAACGITRATLLLAGGSPGRAFALQPLGISLIIACAAATALILGARAAGYAFRLRCSPDEGTGMRFLAFFLLLVNWLYLIDKGI